MPEDHSAMIRKERPTCRRRALVLVSGALLMAAGIRTAGVSAHPMSPALEQPAWSLVWSDEFNGSAGTAVSGSKWDFDLGDGCSSGICGWGNNEQEYYTSVLENVSENGSGQLSITARTAPGGMNCYYGPCRYTSARIKTRAKFAQQYGRFEAHIKLPPGQGLWPAFWMLGSDFPGNSWPNCGEIDIMENRGSRIGSMSSALHGPGYSGNTPLVHGFTLPSGTFAEAFHLFAVEWEPDQIRFYVDSTLHYTVTRANVQSYGAWVYDHPFFIILNLAVGGKFDGDPASGRIFPAALLVDYVRVYSRSVAYLPLLNRDLMGS